jgi:hypothetical protein
MVRFLLHTDGRLTRPKCSSPDPRSDHTVEACSSSGARRAAMENPDSCDLGLDSRPRRPYAKFSWRIEPHRDLEQSHRDSHCQARRARVQRNPIGLSVRPSPASSLPFSLRRDLARRAKGSGDGIRVGLAHLLISSCRLGNSSEESYRPQARRSDHGPNNREPTGRPGRDGCGSGYLAGANPYEPLPFPPPLRTVNQSSRLGASPLTGFALNSNRPP